MEYFCVPYGVKPVSDELWQDKNMVQSWEPMRNASFQWIEKKFSLNNSDIFQYFQTKFIMTSIAKTALVHNDFFFRVYRLFCCISSKGNACIKAQWEEDLGLRFTAEKRFWAAQIISQNVSGVKSCKLTSHHTDLRKWTTFQRSVGMDVEWLAL